LVLEHLAALGSHLDWHGALMIDYLWDPKTHRPAYIDANPRIGETVNATCSGVNLCELLVRVGSEDAARRAGSVSDRRNGPPLTTPRTGVRTHSLFLTLLALAQQGATRRQLLGEMWRAWTHQGLYADSVDELTRPRDDLLSLVPGAVVTLQLLLRPQTAAATITRTVGNYALNEAAVRRIRALPQ
jgi:hypothetical protein